MADRSTAAVGVANEGGEAPSAAQQDGSTSDGTTTDDQTSENAAAGSPPEEPEGEQPAIKSSESNGAAATGAAKATGTTETLEIVNDPPAADKKSGTARKSGTESKDSKAPKNGKAPRSAPDDETTVVAPAAAAPAAATSSATPPAVADTASRNAQGPAQRPKTGPGSAGYLGTAPELHSGHKLARRYQLAECVTRVDGFSSWRAVDEKLRRAVGIHLLPADHPRARKVLAAARSAALLGDPRFVQVLDAVEENDLVYVIHEWLPDATSLADLLVTGAMEPHEAYQMVSQVSQGMAAAHREGLAHLRLDPGSVLRTVSGQYRIRGLAVAAALRGLDSDGPQRQDTEAIGALLYAALTQRWPYEEDAHGLSGLPQGAGPVAPDQVRAGVHRGLSEIAMRALVNDGATASREEPPCTTPEELAKAVAGLPRIRPPEQHVPPAYEAAAFRQPPPPAGATRQPMAPPSPPPALPGRTGSALKWAVAALLIVAIGLGSWQLADVLKSREDQSTGRQSTPTGQKAAQDPTTAAPKPLQIAGLKDFDPFGEDGENPKQVKLAYDNDPATSWETKSYTSSNFGNLKSGVGLILDLGSAKHISNVKVDFTGQTPVDLMAAPASTATMPTDFTAFTKVASGRGTDVTLTPSKALHTRYVLVWITSLPLTDGKYRAQVSEIHVTG
ncbi:protein kinase family protein [Streptomyces sp. CA-111067]|uniref:protein kinase family protein n=1 Tax=Streptomyces sp. CA-111067 TaxID=3240046 RepID=UPI003D9546BE